MVTSFILLLFTHIKKHCIDTLELCILCDQPKLHYTNLGKLISFIILKLYNVMQITNGKIATVCSHFEDGGSIYNRDGSSDGSFDNLFLHSLHLF